MHKTVLFISIVTLIGIFLLKNIIPASAATPTIYFFDASTFVIDRFGHCSIAQECKYNRLPSGKTYQGMIDDYDRLMTLFSIQGLVNRTGPRLWIRYQSFDPHDDDWWNRLRDGSKPYGFLANYQVITLNSFEQVLDTFKNDPLLNGSVEYEIRNNGNGAGLDAASTAAGADGLAINRIGSTFYESVKSRFPVKVTVPYFDHKRDAYLWAMNNYLKTGKSNPRSIAWQLDAWPLVLYKQGIMGAAGHPDFVRDFAIQKKSFIFDLTPWAGEKPADDLNQNCGDDERTFREIFQTARDIVNSRNDLKDKTIVMDGYPVWPWKYFGGVEIYRGSTASPSDRITGDIYTCQPGGRTNPNDQYFKEPVTIEEKSMQFIAQFGAYNSGWNGDLFGVVPSNMSIMYWGKLPQNISNPPPPSKDQLIQKGYLTPQGGIIPKTYTLAYFGDYDQDGPVAAIDSFYPHVWTQGGRGQIPIAWAINPASIDLLPGVHSYLNATRTNNDYFVGPFTAAGYVFPNYLPVDFLPWWKKHNAYYYSQLNIQQSLMLGNSPLNIQAPSDPVTRGYASFSPQGIATYADASTPRMFYGVPAAVHTGPGSGPVSPEDTANTIDLHWQRLSGSNPKFFVFRCVFCSPSTFKSAVDIEKNRHPERNYEVVDPYTFFYLLRLQLGGNNDNKATFTIDDSFPDTMIAGQQYNLKITARNDGWNSWIGTQHPSCQPWAGGCFRLGAGFSSDLPEPVIGEFPKTNYTISGDLNSSGIHPGQSYDFQFSVTAPSAAGEYYLRADMVNELNYWFETMGNLPFIRKISVLSPKTCSLSLSSGSITTNQSITVNFSGNNNNSTNPSAPVSLMLEKSDFTRFPGVIGTELSYTPPGASTQYFYKQKVCTSSGNIPCSDTVTVSNLPVGNYFFHCDVWAAPNACSGQPACSYAGGSDDCTGVSTQCSGNDHASLTVAANLPTLIPTSTPIPPSPTPTPIPGDITGPSGVPDGKVDIYDYDQLISDFGTIGNQGFIPSDINKDGKVDIFDYNILVGNWGKSGR